MFKCLVFSALVFCQLSAFQNQALALEKIFLVRHAEKAEGWPKDSALSAMRPLSTAGVVRAERLAKYFSDLGISAVYASPTTRTLHTGLALATKSRVPLKADARSISQEQLPAFIEFLRHQHQNDQAVLIVGHSNTIPMILLALGATADCFPELGITEYPEGNFIEQYEGIWAVQMANSDCSGITRFELPKLD